jgi:hypothetical protein
MPRASSPPAGLTDTWGRANRKLADRACAACGATFRPARSSARFCSRPCARTINGGHNRKEESWWVNECGYIEGRVWRDGVQVRVKYHRVVMERHIGRPLHPDEDVHHIDGDKQNNGIENLQLLPHQEHTRITNIERWSRAAIAKATQTPENPHG